MSSSIPMNNSVGDKQSEDTNVPGVENTQSGTYESLLPFLMDIKPYVPVNIPKSKATLPLDNSNVLIEDHSILFEDDSLLASDIFQSARGSAASSALTSPAQSGRNLSLGAEDISLFVTPMRENGRLHDDTDNTEYTEDVSKYEHSSHNNSNPSTPRVVDHNTRQMNAYVGNVTFSPAQDVLQISSLQDRIYREALGTQDSIEEVVEEEEDMTFSTNNTVDEEVQYNTMINYFNGIHGNISGQLEMQDQEEEEGHLDNTGDANNNASGNVDNISGEDDIFEDSIPQDDVYTENIQEIDTTTLPSTVLAPSLEFNPPLPHQSPSSMLRGRNSSASSTHSSPVRKMGGLIDEEDALVLSPRGVSKSLLSKKVVSYKSHEQCKGHSSRSPSARSSSESRTMSPSVRSSVDKLKRTSSARREGVDSIPATPSSEVNSFVFDMNTDKGYSYNPMPESRKYDIMPVLGDYTVLNTVPEQEELALPENFPELKDNSHILYDLYARLQYTHQQHVATHAALQALLGEHSNILSQQQNSGHYGEMQHSELQSCQSAYQDAVEELEKEKQSNGELVKDHMMTIEEQRERLEELEGLRDEQLRDLTSVMSANNELETQLDVNEKERQVLYTHTQVYYQAYHVVLRTANTLMQLLKDHHLEYLCIDESKELQKVVYEVDQSTQGVLYDNNSSTQSDFNMSKLERTTETDTMRRAYEQEIDSLRKQLLEVRSENSMNVSHDANTHNAGSNTNINAQYAFPYIGVMSIHAAVEVIHTKDAELMHDRNMCDQKQAELKALEESLRSQHHDLYIAQQEVYDTQESMKEDQAMLLQLKEDIAREKEEVKREKEIIKHSRLVLQKKLDVLESKGLITSEDPDALSKREDRNIIMPNITILDSPVTKLPSSSVLHTSNSEYSSDDTLDESTCPIPNEISLNIIRGSSDDVQNEDLIDTIGNITQDIVLPSENISSTSDTHNHTHVVTSLHLMLNEKEEKIVERDDIIYEMRVLLHQQQVDIVEKEDQLVKLQEKLDEKAPVEVCTRQHVTSEDAHSIDSMKKLIVTLKQEVSSLQQVVTENSNKTSTTANNNNTTDNMVLVQQNLTLLSTNKLLQVQIQTLEETITTLTETVTSLEKQMVSEGQAFTAKYQSLTTEHQSLTVEHQSLTTKFQVQSEEHEHTLLHVQQDHATLVQVQEERLQKPEVVSVGISTMTATGITHGSMDAMTNTFVVMLHTGSQTDENDVRVQYTQTEPANTTNVGIQTDADTKDTRCNTLSYSGYFVLKSIQHGLLTKLRQQLSNSMVEMKKVTSKKKKNKQRNNISPMVRNHGSSDPYMLLRDNMRDSNSTTDHNDIERVASPISPISPVVPVVPVLVPISPLSPRKECYTTGCQTEDEQLHTPATHDNGTMINIIIHTSDTSSQTEHIPEPVMVSESVQTSENNSDLHNNVSTSEDVLAILIPTTSEISIQTDPVRIVENVDKSTLHSVSTDTVDIVDLVCTVETPENNSNRNNTMDTPHTNSTSSTQTEMSCQFDSSVQTVSPITLTSSSQTDHSNDTDRSNSNDHSNSNTNTTNNSKTNTTNTNTTNTNNTIHANTQHKDTSTLLEEMERLYKEVNMLLSLQNTTSVEHATLQREKELQMDTLQTSLLSTETELRVIRDLYAKDKVLQQELYQTDANGTSIEAEMRRNKSLAFDLSSARGQVQGMEIEQQNTLETQSKEKLQYRLCKDQLYKLTLEYARQESTLQQQEHKLEMYNDGVNEVKLDTDEETPSTTNNHHTTNSNHTSPVKAPNVQSILVQRQKQSIQDPVVLDTPSSSVEQDTVLNTIITTLTHQIAEKDKKIEHLQGMLHDMHTKNIHEDVILEGMARQYLPKPQQYVPTTQYNHTIHPSNSHVLNDTLHLTFQPSPHDNTDDTDVLLEVTPKRVSKSTSRDKLAMYKQQEKQYLQRAVELRDALVDLNKKNTMLQEKDVICKKLASALKDKSTAYNGIVENMKIIGVQVQALHSEKDELMKKHARCQAELEQKLEIASLYEDRYNNVLVELHDEVQAHNITKEELRNPKLGQGMQYVQQMIRKYLPHSSNSTWQDQVLVLLREYEKSMDQYKQLEQQEQQWKQLSEELSSSRKEYHELKCNNEMLQQQLKTSQDQYTTLQTLVSKKYKEEEQHAAVDTIIRLKQDNYVILKEKDNLQGVVDRMKIDNKTLLRKVKELEDISLKYTNLLTTLNTNKTDESKHHREFVDLQHVYNQCVSDKEYLRDKLLTVEASVVDLKKQHIRDIDALEETYQHSITQYRTRMSMLEHNTEEQRILLVKKYEERLHDLEQQLTVKTLQFQKHSDLMIDRSTKEQQQLVTTLQTDIQEQKVELQNIEEEKSSLQAQIVLLHAKLARSHEKHTQEDTQTKEQKTSMEKELQTKLSSWKREKEALLMNHEQECHFLQETISTLKGRLHSHDSLLKELQLDLERKTIVLDDMKTALQREKEHTSSISVGTSELKKQESIIMEREDKIRSLEHDIEVLRSDLVHSDQLKSSDMKLVESKCRLLNRERSQLIQQLERQGLDLDKRIAEQVKLERAQVVTLQEQLQHVQQTLDSTSTTVHTLELTIEGQKTNYLALQSKYDILDVKYQTLQQQHTETMSHTKEEVEKLSEQLLQEQEEQKQFTSSSLDMRENLQTVISQLKQEVTSLQETVTTKQEECLRLQSYVELSSGLEATGKHQNEEIRKLLLTVETHEKKIAYLEQCLMDAEVTSTNQLDLKTQYTELETKYLKLDAEYADAKAAFIDGAVYHDVLVERDELRATVDNQNHVGASDVEKITALEQHLKVATAKYEVLKKENHDLKLKFNSFHDRYSVMKTEQQHEKDSINLALNQVTTQYAQLQQHAHDLQQSHENLVKHNHQVEAVLAEKEQVLHSLTRHR